MISIKKLSQDSMFKILGLLAVLAFRAPEYAGQIKRLVEEIEKEQKS